MSHAMSFIIGIVIGVNVAAALAGWVWFFKTKGFDHKLTEEEVKKYVSENWGEP